MSEMRDKQNNAAVPSNMQQDGTRIEVEADKPISTPRMQQLVDELNTYSNAYYFGSEPLISDAEFDALMEELSQLEQASGIVLPNSRHTGSAEMLSLPLSRTRTSRGFGVSTKSKQLRNCWILAKNAVVPQEIRKTAVWKIPNLCWNISSTG